MARKVIVALVLFALLGLASAEADAPTTDGATASGPSGSIGNDEESGGTGFAEAGPVGGPVPDGTFKDVPTDEAAAASAPPKNGASALEVSAFATGVAAAGLSLFYF